MTQEEFEESLKEAEELLEDTRLAMDMAFEHGGTVAYDIGEMDRSLDLLYEYFEEGPVTDAALFCVMPENGEDSPLSLLSCVNITCGMLHELMESGIFDGCWTVGNSGEEEFTSIAWHARCPGLLFLTACGERPYNDVEKELAEDLYDDLM